MLELRFAKWACHRLTEDADFGKKSSFQMKIIWIWFGGYVNKQNCCICGTENPHAYIEKPTHLKRVTVWCGFWTRGIIEPFFFENEQRESVTVNGDRYRAMLNEFLFIKIEEEDIGNICFQQDSVLRPFFEDRIISRSADVVWPPRSCDLTPLDYYLWTIISVTPTSQRQLTP